LPSQAKGPKWYECVKNNSELDRERLDSGFWYFSREFVKQLASKERQYRQSVFKGNTLTKVFEKDEGPIKRVNNMDPLQREGAILDLIRVLAENMRSTLRLTEELVLLRPHEKARDTSEVVESQREKLNWGEGSYMGSVPAGTTQSTSIAPDPTRQSDIGEEDLNTETVSHFKVDPILSRSKIAKMLIQLPIDTVVAFFRASDKKEEGTTIFSTAAHPAGQSEVGIKDAEKEESSQIKRTNNEEHHEELIPRYLRTYSASHYNGGVENTTASLTAAKPIDESEAGSESIDNDEEPQYQMKSGILCGPLGQVGYAAYNRDGEFGYLSIFGREIFFPQLHPGAGAETVDNALESQFISICREERGIRRLNPVDDCVAEAWRIYKNAAESGKQGWRVTENTMSESQPLGLPVKTNGPPNPAQSVLFTLLFVLAFLAVTTWQELRARRAKSPTSEPQTPGVEEVEDATTEGKDINQEMVSEVKKEAIGRGLDAFTKYREASFSDSDWSDLGEQQ